MNRLIFLIAVCAAPFQQAAPQESAASKESPASIGAEVHRRYLRLEVVMGRLLTALKEPAKGGRLQSALQRARELKVADRLETVKGLLETKGYREALAEEQVLEKDLERILAILKGEDPTQDLRSRQDELKRLGEDLERLERLFDEQMKLNEETADAEDSQGDEKELAARQDEVQKRTEELRRALERREASQRGGRQRQSKKDGGEENQDENQAGQEGSEGQEGGEQGKDGKQGGQQGKQGGKKAGGKKAGGKQGGKQGQQGEQKDSQEQDSAQQNGEESGQEGQHSPSGKQQRRQRARESLQRASQRMRGAAQRLEAGNEEGAQEDQEEALAQLQEARDEMEETRDRKEIERQQAAANAVLGRLQAMLSEAKLIRAETEEMDQKAAGPDALSDESRRGDARGLARRELAIGADAEDVQRILEEEGSSLVAPPILKRVREDIENAAGLLDKAETGAVTRTIQADIEAAIEELIEALKPSRRSRGGRGEGGAEQSGAGAGAGQQRPRTLINPVMEIKMLASAQKRVRSRTERIARVPPAERGDQAARIAEAEADLGRLAQEVVKKYAIIDSYILGLDNEDPAEGSPPDKQGEPKKPHAEDKDHADH